MIKKLWAREKPNTRRAKYVKKLSSHRAQYSDGSRGENLICHLFVFESSLFEKTFSWKFFFIFFFHILNFIEIKKRKLDIPNQHVLSLFARVGFICPKLQLMRIALDDKRYTVNFEIWEHFRLAETVCGLAICLPKIFIAS